MKKIVIGLLCLLLISCHQEEVKTVKVKKEPIVFEEVTVEYVTSSQLKELVKKTTARTEVIEIMELHDLMFETIKDKVDLEQDLDLQDDLINEIVLDKLKVWKKEVVLDVLEEESVTLNDDDLETLIARTSIQQTYEVMIIFEKAFLENMK